MTKVLPINHNQISIFFCFNVYNFFKLSNNPIPPITGVGNILFELVSL